MGMEKSTQSSRYKWDSDFQFSAALMACSGSLQSLNILGVTILTYYGNPGSGCRPSSCQWQLDIRWTQGATLKWEDKKEKSTRVDRKSVFDKIYVRDVYICHFIWKILEINSFGSLNISCTDAITGNNDLRNILMKQATQGKAIHCFTLK